MCKTMNTIYVYLIKSQCRLVILPHQSDNQDYFELLANEGYDSTLLMKTAKMFCCAYILGAESRLDIVNDIQEFKI